MSRIKLPTRIKAKQTNKSIQPARTLNDLIDKVNVPQVSAQDWNKGMQQNEDKKDWRNDLKQIIEQHGYIVDSFNQGLHIETLDNLEILMDFEEQHPEVYSEVDDVIFGKCKSFAEMIECINRYMKV